MTAVSPYVPLKRNIFFNKSPSNNGHSQYGVALLAFALLVLKYWNNVGVRKSINNAFCFRLAAADHFGSEKNDATSINRLKSWIVNSMMSLKRLREKATKTLSVVKKQTCLSVDIIDKGTTSDNVVIENQKLIFSVLNYWFGKYTIDESQKKIWMIANSSETHRNLVDEEITRKFAPLIRELAAATTNGSTTGNNRWKEWCEKSHLYGYGGKIAAIVALDQMSRHVRRHEKNAIPSVEELDGLALETAELFVKTHENEIICGMIPLPMHIFALMPFRHTSQIPRLEYVQTCIDASSLRNEQMEAMLRRFRKATNRRLAILQDNARREGEGLAVSISPTSTGNKESCTDFNDILEVHPFDADFSKAHTYTVHKAMRSFLDDQGIQPRTHLQNKSPFIVVVSLSGGVDSMVIVAVLTHLRDKFSYHINVIAIHIDYANRPESKIEAAYLRAYCEQHRIEFVIRVIDEVTRGITARDQYEKLSREARYKTYQNVTSEYVDQRVGIMLGHHRGDLRENVLSNAHKGCGPLDLSGMTSVSQNNGVVIYRPFLGLEKTDIFSFSHQFGVPYFKDTTPRWSTRGKLRNKLIPLLEEIYGEGSMNNLSKLAIESDECRSLLFQSLLRPFMDQIIRKPMGIIFETAPWKTQGAFFWKFVLRSALHSGSLGMFSDKSVLSFLKRIQAETILEGWLQCRRDYSVYLQSTGRVFVFLPKSFPSRKEEAYPCIGEGMSYGVENAVSFGPWGVVAEPWASNSNVKLLRQKAVHTMNTFMDGHVEYFLQVPTSCQENVSEVSFIPRQLVFISKFTKRTRPFAWKNTNEKIQATLPLLGNDNTALSAINDPIGTGFHHQIKGKTIANPVVLIRVTLSLKKDEEINDTQEP